MKKFPLLLFIVFISVSAFSQNAPAQTDTLRKDAVNVFMESTDYIRKEIPYVNYVRDIHDAGVYIISTNQRTGSGGYEYSYFLVGQHEFAGMADTLKFTSGPDETTDEIRQKSVNTLKMGLMRYVARTPLSKYMKISFTEPLSTTVSSDKWNSWVFRSSISGYASGQKTYNQWYVSGNVSASRITEKWKVNLSSTYSKSDSKTIYEDTVIYGPSSSKSFRALIVKSLNDHWSLGGTFRTGASFYSNEQFYVSLMPGIEYDLFPYSESTRHQFRILYSVGYIYENYIDTTKYLKLKDNLWSHSLSAAYQVVQKWGDINLSLTYSNYLHDWSKNNLSGSITTDLRVAKGLTITLYAGASAIHDQLGLRKGKANIAETLQQRRELETSYEFFTGFGFTYTFGSIYNNVVNPRFGNSGGGGISISISD